MKVLAIGDIVGGPGRKMIKDYLRRVKRELKVDLCIANGENAALGNGITRSIAYELYDNGVDVITMGNHVWSKKEIIDFFDENEYIIRPANYPPACPGKGYVFIEVNRKQVAIINLSGRVCLDTLDCPFRTVTELLKTIKQTTDIIVVDFHAEATSEKAAMAWYLDGEVSAVLGTHTHVQTADERILPMGTGFITDIGMTGPYNSILGVEKDIIIERFLTHLPRKFKIADGRAQFNAVVCEINEDTGKTTSINRIIIK